jgi:hypothetical protein
LYPTETVFGSSSSSGPLKTAADPNVEARWIVTWLGGPTIGGRARDLACVGGPGPNRVTGGAVDRRGIPTGSGFAFAKAA